MLGLGVVLLIASLLMDTSVSTAYGDVNNIGLMNDKQNYVVGSVAVAVIGALMLFLPSDPQISDALQNRACPKCAESIKREAVQCRFCGAEVEPVGSSYQTAFALGEDSTGEMSESDLNDLAVYYKIDRTNAGYEFEDKVFQTLRLAVAHARSVRLNKTDAA